MSHYVGGIPLGGNTESNGRPYTQYRYEVETSNRTANSVRVKIKLSVKMQNRTSYFMFWIGHECWVNNTHQFAWVKHDHKMWGLQNGTYGDGDGRKWRGPFVVFDAVVPLATDGTGLNIIPCITRPWSGTFNPNEITNWEGLYGQGYYATRRCPQDGAFFNNKTRRAMSYYTDPYQRPKAPSNVMVTPRRVEIIEAPTRSLNLSWGKAAGATRYDIFIVKNQIPEEAKFGDTVAQNATFVRSVTSLADAISPATYLDIETGDNVYLGVRSYDGQAYSKDVIWSEAVEYFELPSYAPNKLWFMGRKDYPNEILCAGETAKFFYSGLVNGSYPVARYELIGDADGLVKAWKQENATLESAGTFSVEVDMVKHKPRETQIYTLRAYDTKDRLLFKELGGLPQVAVVYYGGVIWRFDESGEWKQGLCWRYDEEDGRWHQSQAVYYRKGDAWKTL